MNRDKLTRLFAFLAMTLAGFSFCCPYGHSRIFLCPPSRCQLQWMGSR